MTDPLYELLSPHFPSETPPSLPHPQDTVTPKYLSRLTTLPLTALTTDEPASLSQSTHSNLLSLQSLSARSNAALVASSSHLSNLQSILPRLAAEATSLRHDIPKLDAAAIHFSDRYSRAKDANALLDRRKKALLIARNIDRISDILDLPTLLASAIASSSSPASTAQTTTTTIPSTTSPSTYASALDLHSHIKRLHLLHPDSSLISSIYTQTESAMRDLTTNLILSLRAPNIKLASALRTIGWLRRVAPELDGPAPSPTVSGVGGRSASEGSLGALFLVSRLGHLMSTLEALSPLRDLADQETEARLRRQQQQQQQEQQDIPNPKTSVAPASKPTDRDAWSHGQQTERYLKRWLEIFREQSFAIVAMYRSIFPEDTSTSTSTSTSLPLDRNRRHQGPLSPSQKNPPVFSASNNNDNNNDNDNGYKGDPALPSALSTFPLHLTTSLLLPTLRAYFPNVRDRSSRESLLTQVLYAAGSLGRLGGEFGMVVAELGEGVGGEEEEGDGGVGDGGGEEAAEEEEEEEGEVEEWVAVMKKHRVLAGKLERMAAGGGSSGSGGGGAGGGG